MLYGKVLRPPSYGAKLTEIDLAPAKAIDGVVVVRDGDFVGVAAPNTHVAKRAIAELEKTAKWEPAPHPSSAKLFDYLRERAKGGVPTNPLADEVEVGGEVAEGVVRRRLRAARADGAAGGGGGVGRTARSPSGRARRTRSRVRGELADAFHIAARTGPRDRPRLRRRLRRQAHRRDRRRSGAPRQGRGQAGRAAVDARGGVHLGLLPPRRRDRGRGGARRRRQARRPGTSSTSTPAARRSRRPTASRRSTRSTSTPTPRRCGTARTARWRRPRTRSPARASWTSWRRSPAHDPLEFRLAHLDEPRLRDVLTKAAREVRLVRRRRARRSPRRPRRRPRVRDGEGLVRRRLRGGGRRPRSGHDQGPARLPGVRVRQDHQPRQPAGAGRGRDRHGPRPALREAMGFEDGKIENASFWKYEVPRMKDVPTLDIHLLDRPDLPQRRRRRDAADRGRPRDRQRRLPRDGRAAPPDAAAAAGAGVRFP